MRNKDIIRETLMEYERKGEFVRIYPARGAQYYEKFLHHQKPIQRFIHKFLFEDDVVPRRLNNIMRTNLPSLEKY